MLLMSMLLAACSTTSGYKGVYGNTTDERPLEIPPDLSQPDTQKGLRVPQLASQQGSRAISGNKVAPLEFGKARLVRESSMRWLEVAMPIDAVWGQALLFFQRLGFKITKQDQAQGVMETDWQENRVNAPGNWFSKLFKNVYDSGLQDRYRLRLERSSDAKHTLVFITQSGLKEVYGKADMQDLATTKGWEPRAPDPELESEMLQRFAIYIGSGKANIQRQVAKLKQQPEFASVTQQDGVAALRMNEGFDRGWRRIGLSLDRLGVQVVDRNRTKAVYYVRFPENMLKTKEGLLSKLFVDKEKISQTQYLLRIIEKNNQTWVAVFDRQGQPVSNKFATHILNQIKSHLI